MDSQHKVTTKKRLQQAAMRIHCPKKVHS